MLQRTGPGAGSRKNLALADFVRGRAQRVSAVLRTALSATLRRSPSLKVESAHRRGQFKTKLRAILNYAMLRAFPLMRVVVSKLPSPVKRALGKVLIRLGWTPASSTPPQLEDRTAYSVLSARFGQLRPVHIYRMPEAAARVTMVTDSVNAGSLFGGVGTAMIFCALLAERLGSALRVVTRTERPDRKNLQKILAIHGIPLPPSVEFVHADMSALGRSFDIRKSDIFITTSWWTTCAVKRSIPAEQIVHIIQEDERMFYPHGDDHLLCHESLSDPSVRFIVNSRLLFDHFFGRRLGDNRQKWNVV